MADQLAVPVAKATAHGQVRPRRRVARWVVLSVAVVVLGTGVAFVAVIALRDPRDTPAAIGVTAVEVRDGAFAPPVVRVERGATVTWTFADGDQEHNVVGDGWGSDVPQARGTVVQTFERVGAYDYACTLHLGMRGRVQVVDAIAAR